MSKKKVMVRSIAPPIEEPVALVDQPQTLPDQTIDEPSTSLLVTIEQFHQLLFRVELLITIVLALQ